VPYWLVFFLILIGSSFLPHWPINFLSWINYSFYFLLFLVSLRLSFIEAYFRIVFINFLITFLTLALSFLSIFVGDRFVVGDNHSMYNIFIYRSLITRAVLSFSIVFLTAKYLLGGFSKPLIFAISSLSTIILIILFNLSFLITKTPIFYHGLPAFYESLIPLDALPLLGLLVYAFFLYRSDRPNGAFMNAFALLLFIYILLDLIDMVAGFSNITFYGADQYFLTFCLIAMAVTLGLRYLALQSDKHQLRERLIFDKNYMTSLAVIDHHSDTQMFINVMKSVFKSRYMIIHAVAGLLYLFVAIISKSFFITIKLSILVVWITMIYGISLFIQKRRSQKGQLLNLNSLLEKELN
jgi:hypothetical protein